MLPCVFIVLSLVLLRLETTTANQLVAVEGRGGDDNGVVMSKCLDKERHALLHFKTHLQDPIDFLSTWTTAEEEDCCTWSGITCNNQTGHVTELKLGIFLLVGEISDSLVNLTYLNHLDLSHNSFHGTIPTFIGSMSRLNRLDLSYNNLTGSIPSSIGSLKELRYLDISNNSLHGTIPPQFGNLTNLQHLYLYSVGRCRVENLEWLSHLSHLEELDMDGISLAKANHWVNVISSLQKLTFLSLKGCELSHVMYPYSSSFLNSSSSISYLSLVNNNLTSSMYSWLFRLTGNSLVVLELSGNMLDGIPQYLGNLCNLEMLFFDNNFDVVKFPDFLSNLCGCASLSLKRLSAVGSQLTGSLSDHIQQFSSLEHLDLSENQLNGTISEKLWELPSLISLHVSSNYLRGAISENIGKSKLYIIDLSENPLLEGVPASTDHMSNLSYIQYIDMSSCKLGPRFPIWIQTLKNLTHLDIANNRISDTVPLEFWNMWPSRLRYLNLSSNNITGRVPDLSSNLDYYSMIDLSFNNFYGLIPNVSSQVTSLRLSGNNFHGGIFFLCKMVDPFLEHLDVSDNFLSGRLPDCLWQFNELIVLNLGNNNLFGKFPASIKSLTNLETLNLYKNDFSGELPLSLKNFTNLNFLDLGGNKFFGNIPIWIGENLSRLYVLILESNNFFGAIPLQLCHLSNLQILDLSRNHLHGSIPSCLNNLTSMVQGGLLPPQNEHSFLSVKDQTDLKNYVDHAMIRWLGNEREFIRNLGLLKSIDLSSNNLTGQIPHELTNLHELLALNLSKNVLLGEIPHQIGTMKNLVALDLSRNKLSGGIPSSMTQMTFLGYLDLSSNSLSGRIPLSTQLQSFEPSRYDGNTGLCGLPLIIKCPRDGDESKVPSPIGGSEGGGEDREELWGWFYIGGCTGFVTGFWIACGALLLNRRGRHAFFHFCDSFKYWVYVKMSLFILKLQRAKHT